MKMSLAEFLIRASPGDWWRDDDGFIAAGTGDEYSTIADFDCGSQDIAEREANKILAMHCRNQMPVLLRAVQDVLKQCALVHKHWGDNCNQKEADAATKALALALDAASNVEVPE